MGPDNLPSKDASTAPSTVELVALIVEDAVDLRVLFARELTDAGFTVVQACDGPAAIEQAHRFRPQAVLLDLMLPGVSGFGVARFLREDERTRDAAIVAVTALASERLRISALEAGCDLFIRKPVAVADVVGQLMRLLEQRRARPDAFRADG
jgi:DNA-binding response OmpR family regulator